MTRASEISKQKDLTEERINGLVLAGGYSSRMGSDKSLMVYHGVPQREFLFRLLKKYCIEVFTSCRKEQQVPSHLNPLYDSVDVPGPLNGILSALKHRDSAWLVIAVDMPFVDGAAIEVLLRGRDPNKHATCFRNPESKEPEPLLTIWEHASLRPLTKFADGGNVSPRDFLRTQSVKMIDPPDAKILMNVNYPGFKI